MELIAALIAMHCESRNGQHGYHFERATEGYNGVVYCATDTEGKKLALKIARKSARNRAWREYNSTQLLHEQGIEDISPKPLSLHTDVPELEGDLIISTWLEGENRVHPPAADEREAWLAILNSLARVHSITPLMTKMELPRAASPAQHPHENYALIHQRFNELSTGQLGQFSHEKIASVLQAIEARIPCYWEDAPELCLIHSDCHSANMLWKEGRVYFVDWENSGWADPALDIANMACNWRFMGLPERHQDWLRGTYAEMRQDSNLVYRAEIYAIQLDMIWFILYSRMLRSRDDNPALEMRDSREFQEHLQNAYYERIHERLSQLAS